MNQIVLLLVFMMGLTGYADEFPRTPEPSKKFKKEAPLPENGFIDFSELEEWAKWTPIGGGSAGTLRLGDVDVFFSKRIFTSSVSTTEIILYTERRRDGRLRPMLIIPVQGKLIRAEVDEGNIVVRCYSAETERFEVMAVVTPWMIP